MRRVWIALAGLIGLAAVYLFAPIPSLAATATWTGQGGDDHWTTAANWAGSVAPSPGDDLVFPDNVAQLTSQNDFASNTAFNSLSFSGAGYTVSGNRIVLANGIAATHPSGTNRVAIPVILTAATTYAVSSATGTLTVQGSTDLKGHTLTVDSAGTIQITGAIINTGALPAGLVKTGTGALTLAGDNLYNGGTSVTDGTLQVTNDHALGSGTSGTNVQSGATLALAGGITVSEPLTLNGNGVGGAGALVAADALTETWMGAITAASSSTIGSSTGDLILNGALGGSGALSIAGPGIVELQGTGANAFSGGVTVKGGTLRAAKTAGVAAIASDATVNSGATLELDADNQIADSAAVTVDSGGAFTLNGFADTIGSLAGVGSVTVGTLTVGSDNSSTTFSGTIAGSGTLTKVGTGTLALTNADSYTGTTTVSAGTLRITNATALGSSAAGTTVQSGATLALAGGITVAEPLTLNGTGVGGGGALQNGDTAANTWSGPVTLAGATAIGGSSGTLTISAAIGEVPNAGVLTKVGAGTLALTGANTYTGSTTVTAGTLRLGNSSALGSNQAANTTVQNGATLALAGGLRVLRGQGALNLAGAGVGGVGALVNTADVNTWVGPVVAGTPNASIGVSAGSLTIDGGADPPLGISSVLTKLGPGLLRVQGTGGSPPAVGTTLRVSAGTLDTRTETVLPDGGKTIVDAGAALAVNGIIVTHNLDLTLGGSGVDGGGALQSTDPLLASLKNSLSGRFTLQGDTTIGGNGGPLEFNGPIGSASGTPVTLTKTGPNTVTFDGANTYGSTVVSGGTLVVNGSQSGGAITLSGGLLGGTGSTGAVTATSGLLAPGLPSGTIVGVLNTGNLALGGSSILAVDLNGTTAGTQYDQVNVSGGVTLSGQAQLSVSLGFAPLVGTLFTIIANDGADAVSGTFAGLPEGAVLSASGVPLRISYAGGTGNDVTLAVLASPTPTLTPTPAPTATSTPTATATATRTPTSTPSLTATPFPRPDVSVQVAPSGGTLQTTITARDAGCAGGNNQLQQLQFTRLTNALVDVATTPPAHVAAPITVNLPGHPAAIGLTVHRLTAGQPATVELTVTDGCGAWPTFVGGGPQAF